MKATLSNYRQSPRKVRLVANLVKGKSVPAALNELSFLPKRAALPISKLIRSAAANLRAGDQVVFKPEQLMVKNIRVDKEAVMKRSMPRARGSASRINKRSSRLVIELSPKS